MSPADGATVLHVDMDAFFVSVELVRRPELRGRPVVVGGAGRRGVVAAASYEARSYGVFSAMPSAQARRLCPDAVFLSGDHAHYGEVSRRVMAIFGRFTPEVEPLSLDEAFLDVSGSLRIFAGARAIADGIRRAVLDEEQLTCSVGIAPNKFLAKMASEAAKPKASRKGPIPGQGVVVVAPGTERAFLDPQPVGRLWGVGPKTLTKLERLGVRTIADVAALPLDVLSAAVGNAHGQHLHDLAHGRDQRRVIKDQRAKSIGHEETYAFDHFTFDTIDPEMVRLADAVAARLRAHGVAGRTITVKLRLTDFSTVTRAATVALPFDSGPSIAQVAKELARAIDPSPGVRLLGISVSKLVESAGHQLTLSDAPSADTTGPPRARVDVDRAIDEVRRKFGDRAIGPAAASGAAGLRLKRRGDQQWGPD